ncbi:MAG: methyltransferase domain-containing protein [Candidatus Binatia bacterium]
MHKKDRVEKSCRDGSGRPTLHDHMMRWGLLLAKLGHCKHQGDDRNFYEYYLTDKNVHESMYDLRRMLRRTAVVTALDVLVPEAVVVDIGCGVGDMVGAVGPHCKKIGIEYSSGHLRLAKKLDVSGVSFIQGSVVTLPLASSSVDAVVFLEVMEHLPDDRSALREIARVLKPGGQLIISVPSTYYFHDYFALIGHYRHYGREKLVQLLREANLQVTRYIDYHPMLQVLHYYPYIFLSAVHRLFNGCGWCAESLYVRRLVGMIYNVLSKSLIVLRRERNQKQLACDERSTFLVAKKSE